MTWSESTIKMFTKSSFFCIVTFTFSRKYSTLYSASQSVTRLLSLLKGPAQKPGISQRALNKLFKETREPGRGLGFYHHSFSHRNLQ